MCVYICVYVCVFMCIRVYMLCLYKYNYPMLCYDLKLLTSL